MPVTYGAFTSASAAALNAQIQQSLGFVRNIYFCDYANGDNANDGRTFGTAVKTLAQAYALCDSGKNDAVAIIGDGGTAASQRVSAAFTWAKSATHLIGVCSPVLMSQRARIAPLSGATAYTPFFTVSGSGCIFQNIAWFHGFATGTTSQINVIVSGQRNYFANCHIAGMGDNESAQSAGSRSLKVTGGENVFVNSTVGIDTITRTQANASLEFASGTARNVFKNVLFPFQGSSAGVLGILGTGAACMDRFQLFDNCTFINAIKSTSTTMTVLGSLTSASPGGLLLFKQCILVGIGEYGDTLGLANSYIDGFTGAAATSGIAVNPS